MSSKFYRYTRDAFEQVPIADLRKGDLLACGGNAYAYGVMAVDRIDAIQGGYYVDATLPEGCDIRSTREREISIKWVDGYPHIMLRMYYYDEDKLMLCLKGEKR